MTSQTRLATPQGRAKRSAVGNVGTRGRFSRRERKLSNQLKLRQRVLSPLIRRISLPGVRGRIGHARAKESLLTLHAGTALTAMFVAADVTGPGQSKGNAEFDAALHN